MTEGKGIRGGGGRSREGGVLKTLNGCWRTNIGAFHQELLSENFAISVLAVESILSRRPR